MADGKLTALLSEMRTSTGYRSCLPAFTFTAEEIAAASGLEIGTIEAVLAAFSVPTGETNEGFRALTDFNIVNASPLLRMGDGQYVLFQIYSIAEALYDTPFYWMSADRHYLPTASRNRGTFTEQFCLESLRRVFGDKAVFSNVTLFQRKGTSLGEVDVLVVFGDRAIVVQAKSKKLTLAARKGNDLQIKGDFKKSVQDAYEQAFSCATVLTQAETRLHAEGIGELGLPLPLKKIYIFCVVSDHYPALSFQAQQFLKSQTTDIIHRPFVMDVFALDVMTEMLESPLQLLNYVDRRVDYGDRLSAAHEITILSYHLRNNLWLDEQYNHLLISDDICVDLDVALSVRREGFAGSPTPDGILTRVAATAVGRLIKQIEADPQAATIDLAFLLLNLGEATVNSLSKGIEALTSLAKRDGKTHDITVGFTGQSTGLTIHCNLDPVGKSGPRLEGYCIARKYKQKADSWYGICISPDASLRFGINLHGPWEADLQMDVLTQHLSESESPADLDAFSRRAH